MGDARPLHRAGALLLVGLVVVGLPGDVRGELRGGLPESPERGGALARRCPLQGGEQLSEDGRDRVLGGSGVRPDSATVRRIDARGFRDLRPRSAPERSCPNARIGLFPRVSRIFNSRWGRETSRWGFRGGPVGAAPPLPPSSAAGDLSADVARALRLAAEGQRWDIVAQLAALLGGGR